MKYLQDSFIRKGLMKDLFMYGFDSFAGLPAESQGVGTLTDWKKGKLNTGDIRTGLAKMLGGSSKVAFVKGFYRESLTPTLVQELGMKPAAYIDIDCDLYISSKQALTYMFEQKLAVPGTLVGYDDFWVNPCCKGYEKLSPLEISEGKAHMEIAAEYGVIFRCVAGSCRPTQKCQAWGVVFVVERVLGKGMEGGDHGFHMTEREIAEWKNTPYSACERVSRKKSMGIVDFRSKKAPHGNHSKGQSFDKRKSNPRK
jgi:hypothetical protein